jgi:hypothetical protein
LLHELLQWQPNRNIGEPFRIRDEDFRTLHDNVRERNRSATRAMSAASPSAGKRSSRRRSGMPCRRKCAGIRERTSPRVRTISFAPCGVASDSEVAAGTGCPRVGGTTCTEERGT